MNRRDMLKFLGISGASVITPEARAQLTKVKVDLEELRFKPTDPISDTPEKIDAIIEIIGRIIDTVGGLDPLSLDD